MNDCQLCIHLDLAVFLSFVARRSVQTSLAAFTYINFLLSAVLVDIWEFFC